MEDILVVAVEVDEDAVKLAQLEHAKQDDIGIEALDNEHAEAVKLAARTHPLAIGEQLEAFKREVAAEGNGGNLHAGEG